MTEAARSAQQPRTDCGHVSVTRWSVGTGDGRLWSCDNCKRRFYPACPVCIIVGHRGEDHIEAESQQRGGLDDPERLIASLERIKRSAKGMTVDTIPFDLGVAAAQDAIRSYFRAAPQPSARLTPQRKPPADPPAHLDGCVAAEDMGIGHWRCQCTCHDDDPAAESREAEALRAVARIVERHTHQDIWAMTAHAGTSPVDDCLLCRALVSAGVLTLDDIGAGTRAAILQESEGASTSSAAHPASQGSESRPKVSDGADGG